MARLEPTRTSSGYWIALASLLLSMGGLATGLWLGSSEDSHDEQYDRPQPYVMEEAIDADRPTSTPPTSERADEPETSERSRDRPSRSLRLPGQQNNSSNNSEARDLQPAVLRVVTNFGKAEVTVNGMPYPEYVEEDDRSGMVLPAGGPYTVKVNYNGKTKVYTISLRPYRTRLLMVELSGFEGGGVASSGGNSGPGAGDNGASASEDGGGRVTVYSKPQGSIVVDGEPRGQQTPGTVGVPAGRHDVQVRFEGEKPSETKTVRVREGSQIKLFFREN